MISVIPVSRGRLIGNNRRMTVISIMNQKGGVGKTTTAVGLAAVMSRTDTPILLVDIDPQASAAAWCHSLPEDLPISWAAERDPAVLSELGRRSDLGIVLVDTPGSLDGSDDLLRAVAAASDFVLVPCEAAGLSIEPTLRTLRQIVEPSGTPAAVVMTKVRPQGEHAARDMREALREAGVRVLASTIRLLTPHEHAATHATTVLALPKSYASASDAADDLRSVALEVMLVIGGIENEAAS